MKCGEVKQRTVRSCSAAYNHLQKELETCCSKDMHPGRMHLQEGEGLNHRSNKWRIDAIDHHIWQIIKVCCNDGVIWPHDTQRFEQPQGHGRQEDCAVACT